MPDIQQEVDWWFRRKEAQRVAKERAEEEAHKARLQGRRDMLLKDEWEPTCTCRECIGAVLSCDPSLVCEKQRKTDNPWWI